MMTDSRPDLFSLDYPRWRWWVGFLWSAPNSAIGLGCALGVRCCGGQWRQVDGTLECSGPLVATVFERVLRRPGFAAITLGDVILAVSTEALDHTRNHERVHVRQYRRWGILFLPAYGIASIVAWARGKDAYRDNVFEVDAYGEESA